MANRFLSEFILNPRQIGAVAPSSSFLAREMVAWFDWSRIKTVIEYGPGTGAFTGNILEAMRPGTRFFAIELSERLAATVRGRWPEVRVYCDSAVNVQAICAQEGVERVDAIICGLPWAAFPVVHQEALLNATLSVLRQEGQFATFAYLQGLLLPAGQRFRKQLQCSFQKVKVSRTVWRNVPPAFIYRCTR